MRPKLTFLIPDQIERIIDQAMDLLCHYGVKIENETLCQQLADAGAQYAGPDHNIVLTRSMIEKALKTVPREFTLYNVLGEQTHQFSGDTVHFTPGSAALYFLDSDAQTSRRPITNDYIAYTKIVSQLTSIAAQSTAFIPCDVPDKISDSFRLFLSLLYCEKAIVTGAFTIESFTIMKNFQIVIRDSETNLKDKPLTIFSCCPTSPLKWSDVTSQNLIDCAQYSIPVEIIAMPLSGFIAPVTLEGTLVQHTAETLSGIVISQLINPGTPLLYGGSPAVFDMRHQTTPMGAIETMMIDCAYNQIGKYFGIPTQAYISLSDAKQLDAQAGLESGIGAVLAALAGINNVSGPGMLDFENCFSLDKLVLDNEICAIALHLIKGIKAYPETDLKPIFQELLAEGHLLASEHTMQFLAEEQYQPGTILERGNQTRWQQEGAKTLKHRSAEKIQTLLDSYQPSRLTKEKKSEILGLMSAEAKKYGLDKLPEYNRLMSDIT